MNHERRKGFLFTDNSEGALRFLTTGAFDALAARYALRLLVGRSPVDVPQVDELMRSQSFPAEWLAFHPKRFKRWNDLFDISCILHRDRSPSFNDRQQAARQSAPLAHFRRRKLARIYPRYRSVVERWMGMHPELLALTSRERPDFFVLASSLLDYHTDEVLLVAKRLGIPTLMLVAGWDNLSSKGLLFHQPKRMGVWGQQTLRHAVDIQGMPADRVVIVGAPHYDRLRLVQHVDRAEVRRRWRVPVDRPLLLFAGSFRKIDETSVLERLERGVDTGAIPAIHLLYRPHPLRSRREHERDFFTLPWRHVTMDPEMVDGYRLHRSRSAELPQNFMDRLDHLQALYRVIDGMISPMSTVLLESLICGVPSIAAAFGDGKHEFGVDKASRMLHLKELYTIPGLIVCRDQDHIVRDVAELCTRIGDRALSESLARSTHVIAHHDELPYAERIARATAEMLGETRP